VSTPEIRNEPAALVLVAGLLTICGLLYISVFAVSGSVWMGMAFGLIEVGVAWRVTPPAAARSLRWVTGGIGGVFTLAWAILWAVMS
jgi:hypothetical protein